MSVERNYGEFNMCSRYIVTKRLLLKSITDEDYNNLISILTDEKVSLTYMVPELKTKEQKDKIFNNFKRLSDDNNHFVYGVYFNNELIGFVNDVEIVDKEIELGFVISESYKNQGFATEVLKASIDELFKKDFCTIKTGVFVENKASARVMEKSGMIKVDREEVVNYRGKQKRCYCYEINRSK